VTGQLTIGRFDTRYLVPREHPDPSRLAARLDGTVDLLRDRLGAFLEPVAASAPEAIWLLRSVELDIALDAGADPDAIAAAWSTALARAITSSLNSTAQGVVFFPDRIAYLASFLRDLAGGEAWSLWYYESFAGLRALPLAAALRTAILAEPQSGLRALLQLEQWALARVIEALGPNEAKRVFDGIADADTAALPSSDTILEAWTEGQSALLCPERLALSFYLALARRAPQANCRTMARTLAACRLELIASGSLARLPGSAVYLKRLPQPVRAALAAPPEPSAAGDVRHTPHGGLFLLLPHLAELPVDALPDSAQDHPLLRFLILAACAGKDALPVFLDPVWRDLFGVPGGMLPDAACRNFTLADPATRKLPLRSSGAERVGERWGTQRALSGRSSQDDVRSGGGFPTSPRPSPPHWGGEGEEVAIRALQPAAELVLARFARRLPGFANSTAPYLRRNFLAARARVSFLPDAIEASLSRPPLDLVLSMAGIGREQLTLPWLDARPIVLRPED
jgi:hypothetical protein